jgi:hypothetical protein
VTGHVGRTDGGSPSDHRGIGAGPAWGTCSPPRTASHPSDPWILSDSSPRSPQVTGGDGILFGCPALGRAGDRKDRRSCAGWVDRRTIRETQRAPVAFCTVASETSGRIPPWRGGRLTAAQSSGEPLAVDGPGPAHGSTTADVCRRRGHHQPAAHRRCQADSTMAKIPCVRPPVLSEVSARRRTAMTG